MKIYRVITETFIEAKDEHEAELKVNDKKNKWELIDVHEYNKDSEQKPQLILH
jgi:hypothetical protein